MSVKRIKFVADVNIEEPLVDFLREKGLDVTWVTEIDKQMPDSTVCEIANSEQRIIVTNDKDFGEIVFFQKKVFHGIILLRIKGQNVSTKIVMMDNLLREHSEKIEKHFVIVTKEKMRFIPLEVI
jgi:predicted nuclease of predicted toxin-antitoxin system